MATNLSSNMNLPVPVVGQEAGPAWAQDLNSSLTIIDSHNHSAGSGVQINPSGINVNTDLPMNGNNLTTARSIRFSAQGSPISGAADLGALSVSGADLYYRDENGNSIRITQSGAVAGTPGSISNLTSPASAAFNSGSGTFIFQSAASTPGNIDGASIIVRDQVASSKGVTINAAASLANNYSLTLPSGLPGATSFMTLDNSGNIGATVSTNGGIVGTNIANQTLTQGLKAPVTTSTTSAAAGGVLVTTPTTYSGSGPGNTNIMSGSITTTGRPVAVNLQVGPSGSVGCFNITNGTIEVEFTSSASGSGVYICQLGTSSTSLLSSVPLGTVGFLDTTIAGTAQTVLYQVSIIGSSGVSWQVINASLVIYEI